MSSGHNNGGWASDDDANDLLAGILDETEEEARSEQERIESELAAKEAEEERRKEEALERKRAEAQARITAEEERLEGLEKRRTMRQEALRIEELKERGDYVEEDEEDNQEPESTQPTAEQLEAHRQRELEQARRREQEERRRRQVAEAQAPRHDADRESRSNTAQVLALVATLALVTGAAAAAYVLAQGSYEPDSSVYSKSVYEPREAKDRQVSVGFTPVAVHEQADEEPEATSRPRPEKPAEPSRPARPSTSETEPDDASSSPAFPDIDESGFDPFSEGP